MEEFIKYLKNLELSILQLTETVRVGENRIKTLENKVTILEQGITPIPVDCKTIDWDSAKFYKESINGKTVYTLGTKNTGNKKVEFKSDFETWTTGKLSFPNSGKCENVWFKVEDCPKEIWGCVTTNSNTTTSKVEFITEKC